jgi:hypothetical protein
MEVQHDDRRELARFVDECVDDLPRRVRCIEVERAEKIQHCNLDAVARFDDGESLPGSPGACVRRTNDGLAPREVVADSVSAIRVVAERDHVGAGGKQFVRQLRGDACAVGDVLAVDDADVGTEFVA